MQLPLLVQFRTPATPETHSVQVPIGEPVPPSEAARRALHLAVLTSSRITATQVDPTSDEATDR